MNVKEIRRRNLRALARIVGGVTQLAGRLEKSQSQISHLIGTNPVKNIGDKFAAHVEQVFNKPHGWLDQLYKHIEEKDGIYATEAVQLQTHYVPFLKEYEIGDWIDKRQLSATKSQLDYVITHAKVSPFAFAMQVEGDSMEAASGVSFPAGAVIVIDPDYCVNSGSFVVVKFDTTQQVVFKQFVIDGQQRFLKPLNPRYPLIEIPPQIKICGVVRLMVMEFK